MSTMSKTYTSDMHIRDIPRNATRGQPKPRGKGKKSMTPTMPALRKQKIPMRIGRD
jgi:hypothetical protein